MSDREGYLKRRDQLLMQDERIAELEKELKWLQSQHVRVCSNEDKLRKLAQAVVKAEWPRGTAALDALAQHLEVTK